MVQTTVKMNVLLGCATALLLTSAALAEDLKLVAALVGAGIIPDVIDAYPENRATVVYNDGTVVKPEERCSLAAVPTAPYVGYFALSSSYYTVLCLSTVPPVTNAVCPPKSQYLLWHVSNVEGDKVSSGDTIATYTPPSELLGLGRSDRILFLVLRQPGFIQAGLLGGVTGNLVRNCFNTRSFMRTNNITGVYAANFCITP